MPDEVHFEIFRREAPNAGWSLQDVSAKRDDAIKLANGLIASKRAIAAKVIKQAYDPKTSDFLSLKIFESGQDAVKLDPKAEDLPPTRACEKPQDFYSREARLAIARLLGDYLARQRLTVTEFIHRADALKAFEKTDAVFQHAVQRTAVAQSAGSEKAVQEIIKALNALVIDAMHRVYHDEERGHFPEVAPGGFAALAKAAAAQTDGAYLFNGALARHLKSAGNWDSKILRLLAVLDEAPAQGESRSVIVEAIDSVIEEILNGSSSLYELIGGRENLNTALGVLTELFLGAEQAATAEQPGLAALAKRFTAGQLPLSRRAVASRILAELKSTKRLCPTSVGDEIKALRRLAARLMGGVGKHLDGEDLAAAFTLRSRRVVTNQALSEIAANALTPDEKLEKLLFVLDNIVGVDNKRALVSFLMPFISGGAFEGFFLAARPSPAAAIKRLAELQARVLRSGFTKEQREDVAAVLDRLAVQVETKSGFFKTIEAKSPDPVEKALFYLSLCQGGVTQGRLAERARKAAQRHISNPDFMIGFAARLARSSGGKNAEAELAALLAKAGIEPDDDDASQSVRPAA